MNGPWGKGVEEGGRLVVEFWASAVGDKRLVVLSSEMRKQGGDQV